jgi:putative membrane protein
MKNGWKIIAIVGLVVLGLLLCLGTFRALSFGRLGARGMMSGGFGGFGGYGMMGGFNPFGWILPLFFFLLLVAAVVLFIVWVIRSEGKTLMPMPTAGAPLLDTLKMRYAKGEITKEQFDAMKKDLGITEA